jgi:hypothetical protein
MKNQQGATLIVVLFALMLIVIVGTLAVKQSILGLKIATSSQAQALLTQNTDTVFFSLEQDNANNEILQKNLSSLGLFGMVKSDNFLNKELVFCYKPKKQELLFTLQNASVITWKEKVDPDDSTKSIIEIDNTELGPNGFCKYDTDFYSSGRDVMITQIAVKKSVFSTDVPFKFYPVGTDTTTVQLDGVQPVRVVVTTIIPGAATGNGAWSSIKTQVNECFSKYTNEKSDLYPDTKTVADCFTEMGVPFSQQVMDYAVVSYATQGS